MSQVILNNWWAVKRPEVKKQIFGELKHSSPAKTTDIEKIVLNMGVGQATTNEKFLENSFKALTQIAQGQKPVITKARKSIINFKLREGMKVGCMVTLRRERAFSFLFELININLALINNFRGFSKKKFDRMGNYHFGVSETYNFPAIPYDLTFKNQGLQISIVFKSKRVEENYRFLELLAFPFSKE